MFLKCLEQTYLRNFTFNMAVVCGDDGHSQTWERLGIVVGGLVSRCRSSKLKNKTCLHIFAYFCSRSSNISSKFRGHGRVSGFDGRGGGVLTP